MKAAVCLIIAMSVAVALGLPTTTTTTTTTTTATSEKKAVVRNAQAQSAIQWMKAQKALVEKNGPSAAAAARRRQGGSEPPVPSYPRQIFSEIIYESADFATGVITTGEGQLYADALVGRSRFDFVLSTSLGELPVSTQYHDDESTEWELFSYGPTAAAAAGMEMLWPWPIECTFMEEIPFISTPDQWSYLGPYFYGSHAGDSYYAFNSDTNTTHYWLQDLYTQQPLLNVYEGYYSEELIGYIPITTQLEPQPLSLFAIPARLDCIPAQSAETFGTLPIAPGGQIKETVKVPSPRLLRF